MEDPVERVTPRGVYGGYWMVIFLEFGGFGGGSEAGDGDLVVG